LSGTAMVDANGAGLSAGTRMAGEERRRQILRVAMRLFSERGFRGTRTKAIAQAAGVSEAMVFRHFATKEQLYSAILDYKACFGGMEDPRVLLGGAVKDRDDRGVFEGVAITVMRYHEQDPEFLRLLTHAALEGHRLAEMFWQTTVRETYKFLAGYIRQRQRDGAFGAIDPVIAVRAFIGMVINHSMANNIWDTRRHILNISNERAAREFTRVLLRGILKAAPSNGLARKRKRPTK
jgi:AcrR family transcriptional regulator